MGKSLDPTKITMAVPLMDLARLQESLKNFHEVCEIWKIDARLESIISSSLKALHYNNYKTIEGYTLKELGDKIDE